MAAEKPIKLPAMPIDLLPSPVPAADFLRDLALGAPETRTGWNRPTAARLAFMISSYDIIAD